MLEALGPPVERVVGQVHVHVARVVARRRLVRLDGKPREALPVEEKAHEAAVLRRLLHVGEEHVEAQVELEPIQRHRPPNVLLHHALLPRRPALALGLGRQPDAVPARAHVRLDDVEGLLVVPCPGGRGGGLDVLAQRLPLPRQRELRRHEPSVVERCGRGQEAAQAREDGCKDGLAAAVGHRREAVEHLAWRDRGMPIGLRVAQPHVPHHVRARSAGRLHPSKRPERPPEAVLLLALEDALSKVDRGASLAVPPQNRIGHVHRHVVRRHDICGGRPRSRPQKSGLSAHDSRQHWRLSHPLPPYIPTIQQ